MRIVSPTILDVKTIFGMSITRVEAPFLMILLFPLKISHWNLLWIGKTLLKIMMASSMMLWKSSIMRFYIGSVRYFVCTGSSDGCSRNAIVSHPSSKCSKSILRFPIY